jgi:tRNA threonylcarbamoyladenosine biosynthesis protein TsaB
MAVILSVETSTSVCSAALHENGRLLGSKEIHVPQSAASQLAVQLSDLLEETRVPKENINAVAVSSGPGSYTGLRIGVATAKGLCFGLKIPLVAINSLMVLAYGIPAQQSGDLLCPMIDARRMEVYCCLLDRSMKVIADTEASIIEKESFSVPLKSHRIVFFGDGSLKCKGVLHHENAIFFDNAYPSAANMGTLAFQKFSAGEFENLALFEPFYLKEFVAKTKSA